MTTNQILFLTIFIPVFVGGVGVLIGWLCQSEGYKMGQVDAINGKIEYKLIEYADGSREWVKDKQLKHIKVAFKIIEPTVTP